MTAYAVRGLDINTSYTIYNLLDEEKKEGVAVVYVGEDLDVLLELCDKILVFSLICATAFWFSAEAGRTAFWMPEQPQKKKLVC